MEAVFLLVLVGGFYLLAIRPQKARIRAVQQTQAGLAPGQQVMTTSGIYGTVASIDDVDVHLEVAPGVVLRFARGAVAKQITEPDVDESVDPAVEDKPSPITPG
ncbi:MAG TPA: preprotein translocase subunit YajC [Mycobacteriales bacterium]|nr:preprotein translocase subunit YajC [Mycobacteriales bacterium]